MIVVEGLGLTGPPHGDQVEGRRNVTAIVLVEDLLVS